MRVNYFALLENLRREGKKVFTTNDVSILTGKPPNYISLILSNSKFLNRIERGLYCLKDADIYEIASNITIPSYVGLFAALRYYNVTTQIPVMISVIALKKHRTLTVNGTRIAFTIFQPKHFFGYRKDGNVNVSSLEKTFVDLLYLNRLPYDEINESFQNSLEEKLINFEKLIDYALLMEKRTLLNRLGLLLQNNDISTKKLLKYRSKAYTSFTGYNEIDRKWRVK